MSFGPLAETHSPTVYDPTDLTEEDTSILVKPMFIHKPSMTSTYDSAESIATHPLEPGGVGRRGEGVDFNFEFNFDVNAGGEAGGEVGHVFFRWRGERDGRKVRFRLQ